MADDPEIITKGSTSGIYIGRVVTKAIQQYGWYVIFAVILYHYSAPHVRAYFSREYEEEPERRQILDEERRRVREMQQQKIQEAAQNVPKRTATLSRQQQVRPARPAPPVSRNGGGGGYYRPSIAKRYPRRGGGG
mmetsp:Transcript_721/g.909  ORF Transcript_721/g.909 Transcript_721/m.909 type:complete len:135 (-) Transcript_721:1179-1583(-)